MSELGEAWAALDEKIHWLYHDGSHEQEALRGAARQLALSVLEAAFDIGWPMLPGHTQTINITEHEAAIRKQIEELGA